MTMRKSMPGRLLKKFFSLIEITKENLKNLEKLEVLILS